MIRPLWLSLGGCKAMSVGNTKSDVLVNVFLALWIYCEMHIEVPLIEIGALDQVARIRNM